MLTGWLTGWLTGLLTGLFTAVFTAVFTAFFTCLFIPSIASATEDHQTEKYTVNVPPSADLLYQIKAKQSGFSVDGEAKVQWRTGDGKYMVSNETRAMIVGKILDSKSEGGIDEFGLAPDSFTEKRLRKAVQSASFHRDSKTIRFSSGAESYAIKGGEQDRNSAIWQLIAVARAQSAKFKPGSSWSFFVAGPRDAEAWSFRVLKSEKISTPLGEIECLRFIKTPPPDQQGQQIEIWLAPALEWYPARLRYTESDGDVIEQNLAVLTRKS